MLSLLVDMKICTDNILSGLDPALPMFITSENSEKLDKSDAKYVDVIHTNALVQGKFERCGHADFYMNGGIFQPNCFDENPISMSTIKYIKISLKY